MPITTGALVAFGPLDMGGPSLVPNQAGHVGKGGTFGGVLDFGSVFGCEDCGVVLGLEASRDGLPQPGFGDHGSTVPEDIVVENGSGVLTCCFGHVDCDVGVRR